MKIFKRLVLHLNVVWIMALTKGIMFAVDLKQ